MEKHKKLIETCLESKKKAYTPYSHFNVGAAVETEDGEIFGGANIEIASYSPTICAERNAIFSAVYNGARKIVRIAITGDSENTFPCGVCRQVMREFGPDMEVLIVKDKDHVRTFTLEELLPHSFGPEDLENV